MKINTDICKSNKVFSFLDDFLKKSYILTYNFGLFSIVFGKKRAVDVKGFMFNLQVKKFFQLFIY